MKSVSPSFHSFVWRSNERGVDAMVKFATAAPDGVNRSSGSPVRLPTTVMMVSPAMGFSWGFGPDASASVRSKDLSTKDRLVQGELTVELLHGGRLGLERDDGVDAFGVL